VNRFRETLRDLDVRRSTYVLCGIWIAVFLLYLWVRPEPQLAQQVSQLAPVPTTTSAPPILTTTTEVPTTTETTTTPTSTETTVSGTGPFGGQQSPTSTTAAPLFPSNLIPTELIPPGLLPASPTPAQQAPPG
jgi:hypothetical protein